MVALILAGCAARDQNVIFVTKTSLGIDVEPSTSSGGFAYDRVEGYSAPRFEGKLVPPVYANFENNGGTLISPKIKQIFATGKAAERLAGAPDQPPMPAIVNTQFQNIAYVPDVSKDKLPPPPDGEAKLPMFFGSGTTFGLKLGFSQSALDGFTLGYKRKEVSVIPHRNQDNDFPSVMASIDTGVATGINPGNTKVDIRQFFATGTAAEALANDTNIQTIFKDNAKGALNAFYEQQRDQNTTALVSVSCVIRINDATLVKVWTDAGNHELIAPDLLTAFKTIPPQEARSRYAGALYLVDHNLAENTARMREHKAYVCGLAER
jgi:hypothetical protein